MLELDEELRAAVRRTCTAIADAPEDEHPIPVGRDLALGVGYPEALLATLPAVAVEAFAGVSNASVFAQLSPGDTVLDLGCGAGLDSLIAAERVGPQGRVVGVDFSASMLARARQAVEQLGTEQVQLCLADSERLPLRDSSMSVALVNGIFNLNPGRGAIFQELARVVRPGGVVYAAELILKEPLPEAEQRDPASWFA
jgi:arsenite methyltransferase